MTGKGGEGGSRIFPELGKVLGCYMPNFRSLGQSLHIDNFCKNEGGGGRGGPYYSFVRKSRVKYNTQHKYCYIYKYTFLY